MRRWANAREQVRGLEPEPEPEPVDRSRSGCGVDGCEPIMSNSNGSIALMMPTDFSILTSNRAHNHQRGHIGTKPTGIPVGAYGVQRGRAGYVECSRFDQVES